MSPPLVKVAVLGATAVGKSTLLQQFVSAQFEETHQPTTSPLPSTSTSTSTGRQRAHHLHTSVSLNGHLYTLRLLDMPAIREFPATSLAEWTEFQQAELRTAHAYVFVFDLSTPASFYYVKVLRDQLFDSRNMSNVPVWVVGNKADLCMNVLSTMRSHRHDHHHHHHSQPHHQHHQHHHQKEHHHHPHTSRLPALLSSGSHHLHQYHHHHSSASPYEDIVPAFKDLANLVRKQWKCSYLECSAKYNWRVLPIFREILKSLEAELGGPAGIAAAATASSGRDSQLGRQSSPRPEGSSAPTAAAATSATPSSSGRGALLPLPPTSSSPSGGRDPNLLRQIEEGGGGDDGGGGGTSSRGVCRIA